METIKFRAWSPTGKSFVHSDECEGEGVYNWKPSTFFECAGDDDIVQQFTGLKDKTGREIYEGDILALGDINEGFLVQYCGAAFCIYEPTMGLVCIDELELNLCSVVGNIHENSELLHENK